MVLTLFPQPESPLSSQEFDLLRQLHTPGFELMTPKPASQAI